jgi:hypothetical protein
LFAVDATADDWNPYFAFEQINWTTGPYIDRGYYGLGAEWKAREGLTLDGGLWHDGTDAYRVTGSVETAWRVSSTAEGMVWAMIDADDVWGLWRLTARHPMGDYDAVFMYEGSTRSPDTFMVGVGMEF